MKFRYFSFIAAASVLAMASCTDDGPNEGNNPDNPNVPSEGVQSLGNVPVNVYTDLSKFGGSIFNYNPTAIGSRSGENLPIFKFDEEYSAPNNLEEIVPDSYYSTKSGVIKQNGTYNFSNGDGAVVYIEASEVVINDYGKNGTYYIKEGASVEFPNGVNTYTTVKAWGSIKTPKIENSYLQVKGDFNGKDGEFTMSSDCSLEVEGNITFSSLTHNKGIISAGTLTINGDLTLNNEALLGVAEFIKVTGDFTFNTNGKMSTKCLDITGNLNIINDGGFVIGKSLSANNLEIKAGGKIELASNAFVNVTETITIENKDPNGGNRFSAMNNDATSYIKASELRAYMYENEPTEHNLGHFSIMPYFEGTIVLSDAMKLYDRNKSMYINRHGKDKPYGYTFAKQEGVEFNKVDEGENADGCIAGSTSKPSPVPPVPPVIIGEVKTDHTHPISATCVAMPYDGKFYLSWHKRGAGQHNGDDKENPNLAMWGCLETLTYDATKVNLTSFMMTGKSYNEAQDPETEVDYSPEANAYDFNHIIYDKGDIIAVGEHPKKGGFIAKVSAEKLDNSWSEDLSIMTARSLLSASKEENKSKGISGNCVVVAPDGKFLIADAGGYQQASRDIFEKVQRFDDKGNAVTVDGGKPVFDWAESLAIDKEGANPFKLTNGSAKHIAINGNMVATIEYTQRPSDKNAEYDEDDFETTLPAKISVYNQYTDWLGTPSWTAEVEEFAPIYGKNVIAVDIDGTVYSCQGRNGVAKYTSGAETKRFNVTEWAENYTDEKGAEFSGSEKKGFAAAAANGLCIAGDYLFVAYGGAGVYVLDKNTMDVLSWYDTGGSANYVQVDNNGIAVIAYGTSGAQVVNFKLDELQK